MRIQNRTRDKAVQAIRNILEEKYLPAHPKAKLDVYRYNSASIRVRIVDPDFGATDWYDRDGAIWNILESLPEDTATQISLLLLLTPKEKLRSGANIEFENPAPSEL